MCGIYGMVGRSTSVDGSPLAAMDRAMVHRGPDDNGTLLDGRCAMGMRRLSIIDLDGGRQPIASEDRAVWVVFNGEIYNHRELRRGLLARGHKFQTASDTEVIVHSFEEKGARFASDLRGMFAAAVWDRRDRSLTLVRDRLGIKPLYYADTVDGLVFASELKSLMEHPWVGRELDPDALQHYLATGTTPSDRAIIQGVSKLPPGHLLVYKDGQVGIRRWWDLGRDASGNAAGNDAGASWSGSAAADVPRTEAEGVEKVRALLKDAVESHLLADVEVGAFLSGGVDSATVVGLMARAGARPRTFSIGFDESDFDELRYARMVSERFGTRHEELIVRPDALSLVDKIVDAIDEPLGDVSAVPTYLVSQLAASKVKVVLSGDGGDEVFGGYDRYPQALTESRRLDFAARRFPGARRVLGKLAAALPEKAYGKYWLRHASLDPRVRYLDGESLFSPEARGGLLTAELRARLTSKVDPIERMAAQLDGAPGDTLGRMLYLDTMNYLPADILTKVDRTSMAHSLEVRPPLLDHPLVEAVFAMPSAWKIVAGEQKRLLKRAVVGLVPDEILHRPKRGFGVPIRHWFRGPLRQLTEDVLRDRRTRERGLFEPRAVDALLAEHFSGRRDQSLRLWSLIVLELWQRSFLDGARRSSAPAPTPMSAISAAHG